ncbi:hypothetical protein JKA74_08135 [Marivirga sp. S37H4]|uniref:Uncharacterized protein n=1 Tax=Marivirga aurantiaca TaxID=2802615 RepID=A0A935CAU3_9BACT|nr:hypothetical protein [Marivirga aurantiaca]MBK6265003.1 hypothetical protein [Marivirga aurantiaca]
MDRFLQKNWRIIVVLIATALLYYFDYGTIALGLAIVSIVLIAMDILLKKKEDTE